VTSPRITSAPGKLVLIGEYAVLFGGPAVVLAVDRRATVSVDGSNDGRWSVRSPGLIAGTRQFELLADGSQNWIGSADDDIRQLSLVTCVLGSLMRSAVLNPLEMRAAALELDTRAFFANTNAGAFKLGLGSSAALTAALATALVHWTGKADVLTDRLSWLRTLTAIHREFQGGGGSGIDLAASLFGGVLEYRLDERGLAAVARPISLPQDLELLYVWTGRSADTGQFLERLTERRGADPGAIGPALDDLSEISRSGIDALRSQRTDALLDAVDSFCEGLEALGRATEIPIMSSEHQQLLALAHSSGVSYKPSGAGGGDLGLAFSNDPGAMARMVVAVRQAGFGTINLSVDLRGTDTPGWDVEDSQAKGVYDSRID